MEYFVHVLVMAGIYTILAASLNLVAGHTGLLSIAHAAFYGLGAYTSALLSVEVGAPFVVGLLAGMVVAAALSLLVSLPSLRLRDDRFVIATFAFQVIVFSVINNWADVTSGPAGIPDIPALTIFGLSIRSQWGFLVVVTMCAVFTYGIVWRLTTGPFGRVLHAVREDEAFAESLGKSTVRAKVNAVAVSSALAALAGSLYAHYTGYIDPTGFTVMESILIISMVIIGGAGSLWGPLIGALVLVSMPELLRFVGLPSSVAANLRQVIYGGLLVVMMLVRPQGLVGRYAFGR